jgi:hypothetical protein
MGNPASSSSGSRRGIGGAKTGRRSVKPDVIFADDREDRQEIGNPEKFPNPFAEMDEF